MRVHAARIFSLDTFRKLASIIILFAVLIAGSQVVLASLENKQSKQDYAEVNNVKYGLFSVDEWKAKLTHIVLHEINSLNLSQANQQELKKFLENELNTMIDQVVERIKKSNEGSFKGRVKQFFINSFVDVDAIKKGTPDYADEILEQLQKPSTQHELKNVIKTKAQSLLNRTFEEQDRSSLDEIMERTGSTDIEDAKLKIKSSLDTSQRQVETFSAILIGLSITLFLILYSSKKRLSPVLYFSMLLALFALLFVGVSTPMIDLEAKISEMKFVLFGQPVNFADQVLYFRSKSILDVFTIMMSYSEFEMKLVGMLMVTFSIILPVVKMLSSIAYYYDFRRCRESKIMQFVVLKSGKWSMADVLVVSIFMAYIGFNGLLGSQLKQLNTSDTDLTLLATNGTTLQPGFYVFMTYVVLAILFTGLLHRQAPRGNHAAS